MYSGQHKQSKGVKAFAPVLRIIIMVVAILGLSWALHVFVFQTYEIPTGSMEKTIMPGDMVFSEKVTYYGSTPQQGDIVTFEDPEVPDRVLIKRVIATEGQTVELIDGQVVVDGVALNEPYTSGKPSNELSTHAPGETIEYPYTIPEGEIWVMGDNRTNSQDSRYFGSIDVSTVLGKAVFTLWPFSNMGLLE